MLLDWGHEEILGRALRGYAKREEIIIAKKVAVKCMKDKWKGLSRKAILHEVEQCLKDWEPIILIYFIFIAGIIILN